jgi:hypothetical protein
MSNLAILTVQCACNKKKQVRYSKEEKERENKVARGEENVPVSPILHFPLRLAATELIPLAGRWCTSSNNTQPHVLLFTADII